MSDSPDAGRIQAMNVMMVERLLGAEARPLQPEQVGLRVLRARGRRSGAWRDTPVGVLRLAGDDGAEHDYLVCPDRRRDWPNNLQAHPEALLLARGEAAAVRAEPVGRAEAIRAVRGYLAHASVPWAKAAFALPDDPTDEQIGARLPAMAIFALADRSDARASAELAQARGSAASS